MRQTNPNRHALQDAFKRQREDFKAQSEVRTRGNTNELRDRLTRGERKPGIYIALAHELEDLGEHDEALAVLLDGCGNLCSLDLHIKYIDALKKRNRTEEAVLAAMEAIRSFPDSFLLRLREGLALPVIYDESVQIERYRERFASRLADLSATLELDTQEQRDAALEAIGHHVNFYLGYQARNDRDLQQQYAALVYRILSETHPDWVAPISIPQAATDGRIRVGYISAHVHDRHVVSRTFSGWISNLNRKEFEVFAYQIGGSADWSTDEVRCSSDHFRHLSGTLESIYASLRADNLHTAIFLDVGMGPEMTQLSSLRLAPVQCVTWGHPITTGSPAIDYFLTSDLMEPADGDEHYSERLIRLPGIGAFYRKPIIPRALLDCERSRFGLRNDSIVYLCSQSSFKYLPDDDAVFARIAKRVPASQFVFLVSPELSTHFSKRLDRAFEELGLRAQDHCVLLPRGWTVDFLAINLTSDIFLDSLGWSGFNTTMDAIACGLPIVTLPGRLMRGRHGYAILTQLGIPETIATDKDDYVDIAVRLGLDPCWRKQVVQSMSERHSRLYSDRSSVVALEQFLREVVGEGLRSG